MFLLGTAQKGQALSSNHHWGICCLWDDGLSTAGCKDILHHREYNWMMNLLRRNLSDKQWGAEHGLCKSDQEDKWSNWLIPSDLESSLRRIKWEILMDRDRNTRQGKQSKIRHQRVQRNQWGKPALRHWEFCRHTQLDKWNSLLMLEEKICLEYKALEECSHFWSCIRIQRDMDCKKCLTQMSCNHSRKQ